MITISTQLGWSKLACFNWFGQKFVEIWIYKKIKLLLSWPGQVNNVKKIVCFIYFNHPFCNILMLRVRFNKYCKQILNFCICMYLRLLTLQDKNKKYEIMQSHKLDHGGIWKSFRSIYLHIVFHFLIYVKEREIR